MVPLDIVLLLLSMFFGVLLALSVTIVLVLKRRCRHSGDDEL